LRPYRLLTNAAYVFLGWIVLVTLLPLAMDGFGRAWATLEAALPAAARISQYFLGISERHPILVLVIVGLGGTFYFLKQSWPIQIVWGPVRAVCTVLGVVLLVHMTGPIADLVAGEPAALPAAPKFSPPRTPAKEAVAAAIKAGDMRYVSVPQCVEEVAGYPALNAAIALPVAAVKKLALSCDESLGSEGVARTRSHREYAAEYNRLMYQHNKAAEPKAAENKEER
jgi:hypothetical protein